MRKKTSKSERLIKACESLIKRREREVAQANKRWQEEIARIQAKNAFTKFKMDAIKAGTWPL